MSDARWATDLRVSGSHIWTLSGFNPNRRYHDIRIRKVLSMIFVNNPSGSIASLSIKEGKREARDAAYNMTEEDVMIIETTPNLTNLLAPLVTNSSSPDASCKTPSAIKNVQYVGISGWSPVTKRWMTPATIIVKTATVRNTEPLSGDERRDVLNDYVYDRPLAHLLLCFCIAYGVHMSICLGFIFT